MTPLRLMPLVMIALIALALSSDPAFAKQVRGPITGVIGKGEEGNTGGSGNGEFAGPSGVAIEQATGNVYVVDSGNNRVEEFEASGAYVSQFGGSATPAGSFSGPTAIAVDQQTGDLYVADTGHNVVDKFTASGEYLCELSGVGRGCQPDPAGPSTFSAPAGVAVDPTSGDVYVSDRENDIIDTFTRLGADVAIQFQLEHRPPWGLAVDAAGDVFVAQSGEGRVSEYLASGGPPINIFTGRVRAVGVDLQNITALIGAEPGEVYRIEEFGSSGNELASFGADLMSAPKEASPGIAVNSTGVVYAADTGNNVVDMFGPLALPEVTTCTASAVGTTAATLHGEVNPEDTSAESLFQYGTEETYGLETPLALVAGGAKEKKYVPVKAEISGLSPGTTYHCRLAATNATGVFNYGADSTFETLPLPPAVDETPAYASEVTTEDAVLNGFVNPGNGSTTYHFAYGRGANDYTQSLPDIGVGSGLTPIAVAQAIPSGSLRPNTTYHFALIATNAAKTTVGTDETFTTASAGIPPEVPPVLGTGPAESITPSSAILTAGVYPEGTPTMYMFEFGTDSSYGTVLPGGEAGGERGFVAVAETVDGLLPGVTYHYRVVAFNAAGTTIGADRIFMTPSASPGIGQPAVPQLLATPVFPVAKVPLPKQPKPKKKPVKKKHKARKARTRARAKRRA